MTPKGRTEPRIKRLDFRKSETEARYLENYFLELLNSGIQIDPPNLKSWAELTGVQLTAWESSTLLRMFAGYREYLIEGKDINCFDPLLSDKERAALQVKLLDQRLFGHATDRPRNTRHKGRHNRSHQTR